MPSEQRQAVGDGCVLTAFLLNCPTGCMQAGLLSSVSANADCRMSGLQRLISY